MFVNTSPKAVRELAAWGVPWSRITPGDRQVIINGEKVTITERKEAAGLVAQRDFGGTKKWRTCYVSDCTGHSMLNAVSDRIIAEQVPVIERVEALSLIHDGKRCYGAIVRCLITGELMAYVSKATAIATGGAGRIYRVTTNAVICEGTGYDLALETGVASLGNMEAIQFHPTGIFPAGILVTEGCRGDGGLLRDVDGHRFMPDVEPEKKELASRDVVSRRMEERIAQGKGVKSRFGEHIWLDITLLGEHHIKHKLREVYEICHYFLGVDPTKEWVPVRPAQHYTMGGVRTKPTGESPTLKGLFAAGEAACWDMHGFNRLGGNSVAETVVAGMIVGEFIADFCDKAENGIDIPTSLIYGALAKEEARLKSFMNNGGSENAYELRTRMQEIMTTKIGIFRKGADMESAVAELEELYKRSFKVSVKDVVGPNPELIYAYRTQKMLRVALSVAYGALNRKESRGAHYREDFPVRNDIEWLNRTIATWKEGDTLPTLNYEKLDISKMELPPGFRGYGVKNYIENPESAKRQAEVDAIRAKMEAAGADRFAIQDALMPYQDLLPKRLKGKNERVDEPLKD
jgi:fumarate reductase flavoprotein subunit